MNKTSKTALIILGTIAIFFFTRAAIPTKDTSGLFLSPPPLYSVSIMDAISGILALAVSIAYWHWLWKK